MEFREIQLEDALWITPLLKKSSYQGCDYTFGNLFIWKDLYKQQVALNGGMLCTRSQKPGTGEYQYLYPAGDGDLQEALEFMRRDAKKMGVPFLLRGFTKTEAQLLTDLYPGVFQIESTRSEWDYLYPVKDLSTLAGKKFHGKRNHIARFEDGNDWKYETLTSENKKECQSMFDTWYEEHANKGNTGALFDKDVVKNAFRYFNQLQFTGGILYRSSKVVGFTIGEPINKDTYAVHIEKAFFEVQGAYAVINREYVRHEMQDYQYVNREEDDGLEGLRKAKESYHPIMLEKFVAREVN
ncbi:MAG TPA: phosphatidylglycerol lysyltransferase domain-containing protein [Lachnospiraceae bacterium]|nr:phosphatidylglycerol lysyltransferase domain-containing protein [Lachnospiraceae bacterium]